MKLNIFDADITSPHKFLRTIKFNLAETPDCHFHICMVPSCKHWLHQALTKPTEEINKCEANNEVENKMNVNKLK